MGSQAQTAMGSALAEEIIKKLLAKGKTFVSLEELEKIVESNQRYHAKRRLIQLTCHSRQHLAHVLCVVKGKRYKSPQASPIYFKAVRTLLAPLRPEVLISETILQTDFIHIVCEFDSLRLRGRLILHIDAIRVGYATTHRLAQLVPKR